MRKGSQKLIDEFDGFDEFDGLWVETLIEIQKPSSQNRI